MGEKFLAPIFNLRSQLSSSQGTKLASYGFKLSFLLKKRRIDNHISLNKSIIRKGVFAIYLAYWIILIIISSARYYIELVRELSPQLEIIHKLYRLKAKKKLYCQVRTSILLSIFQMVKLWIFRVLD